MFSSADWTVNAAGISCGNSGSSNGNVQIPTNCCNNTIGQTFFPFQVIGWVDSEGNTCGVVDNGSLSKNCHSALNISVKPPF